MLYWFKKTFAVVIIFVLFGNIALAHEGKGVPQKELKMLFPKATSFVAKPINLNDEQHKEIEKALRLELGDEKKSMAYIAVTGNKSLGMAWLTHAKTPTQKIDVWLAVNSSGSVLKVALLDETDKSLNNPAFLQQFAKKHHESKFTEIKLPQGKEKEGNAIVLAVRKALLVLDTVIPHTKKDNGRPHTEK